MAIETSDAFASSSMQTYLFGAAIQQSLSPAFHNACYEARGVDWSLERIDSTDMQSYLERIRSPELKFGGSAVTMPHKAAILQHVDEVDPQAAVIGAANTLFFRHTNGKRKLVATNTDVAGIRDSILAAIPPMSRSTSSSAHTGLVIGGGGTTRTAIYTLRFELHCKEIYIINRLDEEVDALVQDFARQGISNIRQLKTPEQVGALQAVPRFIVNAIPSFTPQTDGEKLARATLTAVMERKSIEVARESDVFLEMCYFPHTWTDVCGMAKASGYTVVQGMECMFYQAIAQQLLWLGPAPPGIDLLQVGRRGAEAELKRRAGEAASVAYTRYTKLI